MTADELAPGLETEGLDEAAAAEPRRTSAWSAPEHRDFRLYWIGFVVSKHRGVGRTGDAREAIRRQQPRRVGRQVLPPWTSASLAGQTGGDRWKGSSSSRP